jgi:hypothetical protein
MKQLTALRIIPILFLVVPLYAHLDRNSLSIKGGEAFTSGDSVTITWKMAHAHTITHYLYFRPDSTNDWALIDSVKGQQSGLNYTFKWPVPQAVSSSAQIRVFLPEFSKTPSTKTDDFTLISKSFSIKSAKTGVAFSQAHLTTQPAGGKRITFDLSGRSLDSRGIPQASMCLIVNRFRITESVFSKKHALQGVNLY